PQRGHAQRLGEGAVFAFDVEGHAFAAVEDLAGQQRLDAGRLAPADLADDHGVGAGDDLGLVELPGVVAERRAVEVPADVDLPAGQTPFGHERIGGLEVG